MKFWAVITVCLLLVTLYQGGSALQCGKHVGGALCPGGLCCSQFGYCGNTDPYCGDGCQSQCDGGSGGSTGQIAELISEEIFEKMLKHRNDAACPGRGFYTYDAFINASNKFPEFGNTGDDETRKREIAAFLAQTSHETTGGWDTAPDGPYSWGYCFKSEVNAGSDYCAPHPLYPCVPGKKYYGRGPIQLSWNYNYGQAGTDLGLDLLTNPDLVTSDPILSFETAFWFWMTPQSLKPSCHDVITDNWFPSRIDWAAGRIPGYGVTTNMAMVRMQGLRVELDSIRDIVTF